MDRKNQGYGYDQPSSQAYGQPHQGYHPVPQNYYEQQQPMIEPHRVYANDPMNVTTRPTNYMVPAIFACLCCFWPTGICAIIAANNANTAADSGDMAYAEEQSKKARSFVGISIILGIICITVGIVLKVVVYSSNTQGYN